MGVLLALSACGQAPSTPPGYQGVVEHESRSIAFEAAGRVDRVLVRRGDLAREGQVIASLDDGVERLIREARQEDVAVAQADLSLLLAGSRSEQVDSITAQVRAAQTRSELSRKSAERTHALFSTGAATQVELERSDAELARSTYDQQALEARMSELKRGARPQELARARARLAEAKVSVALEDERLAKATLTLHGDGEVLDVHVKAGELASVGTVAVTVADTAHPYVDVFVPEGALGGIRVQTHARIRVDSLPDALEGAVEHVAPKAEFTPRFLFSDRERPHLVFRVRVRVEDPQRRLHAGLPAFAELQR